MKYINNRENFLNKRKPINENFDMSGDGGPFHNDINWGDSLVGRLINSFRRRAGAGVNMVRIKQVISRLKSEFDNIIYQSQTTGLSDEDKTKIANAIVYDMIYSINFAITQMKVIPYSGSEESDSGEKKVTDIEKKEFLKEVEDLTISVISEIKSRSKDGITPDNKDSIIAALEELLAETKRLKSLLKTDVAEPETKEEKPETVDKKFEMGKYYLYTNSKNEISLYFIKNIKPISSGGNSITFNSWNGEKWGAELTNGILNPKGINKEISVKEDGKLDLEGTKFSGSDISPILKDGNVQGQKTQGESAGGNDSNTTGTTSENKLYKYSDFIRINEEVEMVNGHHDATKPQGDENTENDSKETTEDNKEVVTYDTQQTILKKFWVKLCDDKLTALVISADEAKKINSEVTGNSEDSKSIIVNGIDPVIEILKCFNRAYKLHTTQVIPSGRTGGQVSNKTFREYTCFGTGSPKDAGESGGPYRHIKVFNIWENAVLDILKNRKYQPIFDKNTKLQVGDKMKEGAGTILSKLVRDLLDGESLYRSGSSGKPGGAQEAFLNKYFGDLIDKDSIQPENLAFGRDKELNANNEIATKITNIELKFTNDEIGKGNDDVKNTSGLKGTMFRVENVSTGSTKDYVYFYIQEVKNNELYTVYTKKFGAFARYLENNATLNNESCSLGPLKKAGMSDVFLTKIHYKTVEENLFKKHGSLKLNGVDEKFNSVELLIKVNSSCSWLRKIEDDEKKSVFKITKFNFSKPNKSVGFNTTDLETKAPETKK